MKCVIVVTAFLVLWIVNQVVPANGQLSRTSPSPGSVVCPGARVEYTCQTGEAGGMSILVWSIDGVDLSPSFNGQLSVLTSGDTRNFSGGVATLTSVFPSGFTSTLVIDSAGEGVTNGTVIGCDGIDVTDENVTFDIVSTEVTSVTLSPGGLTVSTIQVGVATSEAEMCTDTVYCVDITEANIMNHCVQSRTISLPQELNLCQRDYNVTVYRSGSTTMESTMVTGNPDGLGNVTNIKSNSSLFWSPPANRPEDCVTGYEISWDGGSFIHSPSDENMPSVSFEELKRNRFPVCETVDVTISPFLPALGVLRNKGAIFKRQGLDAIEDVPDIPVFNSSGSVTLSVGWNRFDKSIQDGDSCSCTIGTVTVNCDSTFSSCERTVEDGSELFEGMFSYSISINYIDCPILSETGNFTAPTLIIDAPIVEISETSVIVTLNLNSGVDCNNLRTDLNVTTDPPIPPSGRSTICFGEDQLMNVTFTGLNENTEYNYTIEVQSHQTIFGRFKTGSSSSEFPWWIIVIVVVVGGGAVGGGTTTAVVIYKKKQKKKSKDEEEVELKKPGDLSPPPVPSEPTTPSLPTINYADPNDIKHETGPETGELYAVAAKPRKKKNEQPQELATYQDPNSIKHEAAGEAGDMYAIPDKKPKKSSKKTKTAPEPQPTEAELQQMYSVPDKTKKTRNQGLNYADIDLVSGRNPPAQDNRPGEVTYTTVSANL